LTDDDFAQAGQLYRIQSDEEKTDLINNIAGHIKNAKKEIRDRQIAHFKRADPDYGQRVQDAVNKLVG
jgi:catalase